MHTVSKAQFADLAGVSRQAINKATKAGKIPVLENGKIDPTDAVCRIYIKTAQSNKIKKAIDDERSDSVTRAPRNKTRSGGRPTNKEASTSEAMDRRTMEDRKLQAQVVGLELKNMIARGELGNIKFMEDLFFTQLAYMTTQNMTIGESLVDDLISMALADGTDARTKIVMKIDKKVNAINKAAANGWNRNIERIKSEFIAGMDSEQ